MRKKWVTHLRPAEIAAAAKTTRTVRCVVKDGKALLQYSHQVCMPLSAQHPSTSSIWALTS